MQKNMDIGGAPYVPWGTPRDMIPSRYRRKNIWKRLLSGALTAVMLAGLLPAAALAAENSGGLCPHHREHTETCGYLAPVEGAPCGHIHEAGCYSGGILPAEGEEAAADACAHTHDETCGYAPATAGTPCGFACPICPVQALIDALPTADELAAMSLEEQQAVYEDLQTAYEAYNALTDEQKAEVTGAEIFESLFDVFHGMVNTLENQNSYNINENVVTIDDSCGDSCHGHTITGSGQTTKNTITVTGGIHNITIENVNINVSDTPEACAFSIESGATVRLTLEGSSTLKSGTGNAGLQVPEGATLTIGGAEAASLTVQGGSQGAGIGGGKENKGGTITISGGNIDATGGEWGAAIGGGDNSDGCGSIRIEGGKLTLATIYNSKGGCLGYGDDENAQGGSVTITGGVLMLQEGDTSLNRTEKIEDSLIWVGNAATVYGTFAMDEEFAIEEGQTLQVPTGAKLIISRGITLTNNGVASNLGTISGDGSIQNNGDIYNLGLLSVKVQGKDPIQLPENTQLISAASVEIGDCGDSCSGHTITGTSTQNTITVTGGKHNITIVNVDIQVSGCAFSIGSGATVNLTLKGSSTLKSGWAKAGLQVAKDAALTINGAEAASLTVQGGGFGAGIGGGEYSTGGDITIKGGDITATGGDSAAIGGGKNSFGCGNIKIEGGKLTLATNNNSRGGCLGYADDNRTQGGSVSITGGEIKFNEKPAVKSGTIEISGSALMLQEGDTSLDTTEIEDSLIWVGNTAMVYGTFTMGGGYTVPSGGTLIIPQGQMLTIPEDVTLTNEGIIENIGTITINGTLDNASGTIQNIEGGGGITGADNITGNSVVTKEGLHYLDWDDSQKKLVNRIRSYSMTTELNGNTWGEEGKTTWYFVPEGSHRFNERPVVVGDVHLILKNNCDLVCAEGIKVEEPKDATVSNKLTIYAQSNDSEEMGKLTTGDVSRGRAGIGSDYEAEKRGYRAGQITINGGKVTAIARAHDGEPAGIGGGGYSGGAGVVINGGVVDARGYSNYGGYKGIGGPATVNGGVVTANGIEGSVTINDGVVVSTDRTINKDNSASWNGLVIEQAAGELSGKLYGTDVTLGHDFTIPEGTTVTIGKDQTLTVNGATLTNNGTITGYGTLDGNGDLEGSGTIADTIKNNLRRESKVEVEIEPSEAVYGSPVTITAEISRAENALTRAAAQNKVDFYLETADGRTLLDSVDVSDNTAILKVSLNDEKWTAGQHTITAEYGGSTGLKSDSGTASFTVIKANQAGQPSVPAKDTATATSITLQSQAGGQAGVEYGYTTAGGTAEDVSNWQANTMFRDLAPGTSYTFYARYAGNDYYNPSDASAGRTIYTLPEITTTTENLPVGYVGVEYNATLEAAKADDVDVTWSLVGETPLPTGLSLGADGTIKGTPTAPTDTPVTFTVQATINGNISNTKSLSITVHKGTPDFGTLAVSGYSGEGGAFVYGDTITISGTIQASSTAPITNALTAPAADEAALFLGNQQLTEPVAVAGGGSFTIQYDTSDKGITPDAAPQTLTVKYGGSDNLTTGERTTTITLLPKPLTAAITGTTTKVYDGTTKAPEDLSITLSGVVGEDDVTATAAFAYDGKDVGDQTITASNITLGGIHQGNYKLSSTTATADGFITESGSTLTATAEKTDLTYGDTLSITVTPSTTGQAPAANAIRADGKQGVELFYEGASLAAADAPNDKGEYVLTYDTAGKAIPIGKNISLTVQFYGDGNMAASGTTTTISLAPKPVIATVDTPVSKVYDQGKEIPLTLSIAKDSLENTGDAVMVTATGTFDSADVGESKTVTVGALTVAGADAGRYSVTASQNSVTGSITEAKIEGTLTITGDAKVDCTLTAVYTPKSGEAVSYQWSVDGTGVSEATEETYIVRAEDVGKKITVTATAADTNHTGSVTSEAVTAGKGDQEAPPQPKVKSVGTYSLEVEPMEANPNTGAAVEFSIDGGEHWQTKTVFDGLSSSSTYEIIARYGENDAYNASPASEPVEATTHSAGGGDPTFPPTIKPGEGGEVAVKPRNPEKGDKVTITPKPEKGYEVDEVIVTDRDGDQVTVTDNGDGTYSFIQPNGKVTIEVTFREIGPEPLPFTDVPPDAWYIDGVRYVYTRHIMNGTSPTTFSPSIPVSRGMIVQILYKLAGQPEVEGSHDFSDVPAGYWSEEAIIWAVQTGVVSGYGNGTFGPGDSLSREQLAVVLFNYANAMGYGTTARRDLSGFDDVTQAQDWARTALEWAYAEHLITGTSGTSMSPTGQASRAQIAVIMMRFCERYAESE